MEQPQLTVIGKADEALHARIQELKGEQRTALALVGEQAFKIHRVKDALGGLESHQEKLLIEIEKIGSEASSLKEGKETLSEEETEKFNELQARQLGLVMPAAEQALKVRRVRLELDQYEAVQDGHLEKVEAMQAEAESILSKISEAAGLQPGEPWVLSESGDVLVVASDTDATEAEEASAEE